MLGVEGKVCTQAEVTHTPRAYFSFHSTQRLTVLDEMLFYCRFCPPPSHLIRSLNSLLVPNYTPRWRGALPELSVLPGNTTQWPWAALNTNDSTQSFKKHQTLGHCSLHNNTIKDEDWETAHEFTLTILGLFCSRACVIVITTRWYMVSPLKCFQKFLSLFLLMV